MARNYRSKGLACKDVIDSVADLFKAPCYEVIREVMVERAGMLRPEHPAGVAAFARWTEAFARILCINPSPRFHIDAGLISEIRDQFSSEVFLPKAILPFYLGEWLYFIPPQPLDNFNPSAVLYGISFPGLDRLNDLHLLKYPWLYHEMGHLLLDKIPDAVEPVNAAVEDALRKQRKRARSSSPEIQAIIESRESQYRRVWSMTKSRSNWSVEIVADVITLWCSGPAFLAAYEESVVNLNDSAYDTSGTHPPNELRSRLLTTAAEILGWDEYLGPVRELNREWKATHKNSADASDYAAITDPEICETVLKTAIEICKRFKLPKCDHKSIEGVRKLIESSAPINSPAELIIGAWLIEREQPESFPAWEESNLRKLSD